MSLKRKLQRNKKKKAEKELKDKVMSFDRMPDCCVMCYKDFDRKSREHHDTWTVVERREEKRVSLFCPDCWEDGLATVKEQLCKKQTELDKHLLEKQDPNEHRKKAMPNPSEYPQVEDYVKKSVPKVEEE
jgi:hypothetical protein